MSRRVLRRLPAGIGSLWVDAELEHAFRDLGLDRPSAWTERISGGTTGTGRGSVARVTLPGGRAALLKQLRRGGWAGALWCDRFVGRARLRANLEAPGEARARGVPTPAVLALLEIPGPPGLFRGWLALEDIPETKSLLDVLRSALDPSAAIGVAMAAARVMHDVGVEHVDLNLGNLLVRDRGGKLEGLVIDLDRVRLRSGPIPVARRRRALRRLERSYVKSFRGGGPLGATAGDRFVSAYAAADTKLEQGLRAFRTAGRLWLFFHRLGWGDPPESAGQARPGGGR